MVKDEPESVLAELRDLILNYLQKNPSAADSLKGVMDWWLPQTYEKVDAAKIEHILEQLIADGLVRKSFLIGGTILYRQGKVKKL